jgi:hypothetical protein
MARTEQINAVRTNDPILPSSQLSKPVPIRGSPAPAPGCNGKIIN